jgi:hypothetical protein
VRPVSERERETERERERERERENIVEPTRPNTNWLRIK